eukprot:2116927-Prymnesium_polylepis.1
MRFGSPQSVARRTAARGTWVAQLDLKLESADGDGVVATPEQMTLIHKCDDADAEADTEEWSAEEWA